VRIAPIAVPSDIRESSIESNVYKKGYPACSLLLRRCGSNHWRPKIRASPRTGYSRGAPSGPSPKGSPSGPGRRNEPDLLLRTPDVSSTADRGSADSALSKSGSCPKSVIDDKRFPGNELRLDGLRGTSPKAGDRTASGNPKPPGCLRFGTSGNWCGFESQAGAPQAFERLKPFSEGRQDDDDDVLALVRAQMPHLAVARETQAGSQLQGSKGPQVPLHFSDTSPKSPPAV
jgi:hypothetical protein